jgi:hypothetical protein
VPGPRWLREVHDVHIHLYARMMLAQRRTTLEAAPGQQTLVPTLTRSTQVDQCPIQKQLLTSPQSLETMRVPKLLLGYVTD